MHEIVFMPDWDVTRKKIASATRPWTILRRQAGTLSSTSYLGRTVAYGHHCRVFRAQLRQSNPLFPSGDLGGAIEGALARVINRQLSADADTLKDDDHHLINF